MENPNNAEYYGYEGEMTPLKCDELKIYVAPTPDGTGLADYCLKSEVDAAIDELKTEHHNERHEYIEMVAQLRRENAKLKAQVNGFKNLSNLWAYNAQNEHNSAVEVRMENAKLKKKLEDVQASMYADVVDANMKIRRLQRALYKACANWAHHRVFVRFNANEKAWENMERKCIKKAEEYK